VTLRPFGEALRSRENAHHAHAVGRGREVRLDATGDRPSE
jgi:hypothetical protein